MADSCRIVQSGGKPPMAQLFLLPAARNSIMENFEKTEMTTLVSCTNRLVKEGFSENFVAHKTGIEAPTTKRIYVPSEVRILNFYRFEGESDPADNSVVYAIEANDGTKGLLIDAYGGPYVD